VKALIILAIIVFLYLIRDILAILFISLLFASALTPWITAMEHHRIPRRLGILLIYLSIISIIALSIVLIVPPIIEQYNELVTLFPQYSEGIVQFVRSYSGQFDVVERLKEFLAGIQSNALQFAGTIFTKIFDVISGIVALLIVFVVTFYMVAEEGIIRRAVHSIAPQKYHESIDELTVKIQHKIGLWLRGQFILSFIIFALSFIGLSVLGVKYALILALFAGLTEFVPILGPILGSIPAIFIAFNQTPLLALFVILLYLLIQRMENDFLVPTVMQKAVGVNPLVSIIALLIGGKLGGIVGMLLAIPVVTVVGVIIDFFTGEEEKKV
jgi:predicted PurR-regulated permease PerM